MSTIPEVHPTENPLNITTGIITRILQVVTGFSLLAAILFLTAGRFNWLWAWVTLGLYFVSILINGMLMFRTSPETIAERGRLFDHYLLF